MLLGVYKAREIEIEGSNLENIFPAMDFLTASNKKGIMIIVKKLFDQLRSTLKEKMLL